MSVCVCVFFSTLLDLGGCRPELVGTRRGEGVPRMEATEQQQSHEFVHLDLPLGVGVGSINSLLFSGYFELGFLSLSTKRLLTHTDAERENDTNQRQRENSSGKLHAPQKTEFLTIFRTQVPVPPWLGSPHRPNRLRWSSCVSARTRGLQPHHRGIPRGSGFSGAHFESPWSFYTSSGSRPSSLPAPSSDACF